MSKANGHKNAGLSFNIDPRLTQMALAKTYN